MRQPNLMKINLNLLLAGIVAMFCCSIANAQIIYSNFFDGGAVTLNGTTPTIANSYAGGTNAATWQFVTPNNDLNILASGVISNANRGTALLPFIPQAGHIYRMNASVNVVGGSTAWLAMGFSQYGPTNLDYNGGARFADTVVNGFDWVYFREGGGQFFLGGTTKNGTSFLNYMPTDGTYTVDVVLDTINTQWSGSFFINGVQFTNLVYASNPTIGFAGIGETSGLSSSQIGNKWWNYWTISASLAPFMTQQPTSQTLSSGDVYTNTVSIDADTGGGTLFYQWYADGAPLVNGGDISGADTNVLIINPVSTANQFTNYYVVVTNNYGSVTSSLASLTILTNPVVTVPTSLSNSITLFAGAGDNTGSSPTFLVTAVGAPTLTYQWLTNGVVVDGATNNSISFTNLQLNGPAKYACIVSNSFGQVTSTWYATYITAPTAAYPQAVLEDKPLDFWRLNEPDDGNGNGGVVCHDYQSGANGIYTNVILGNAGYNALEPTETSMYVTAGGTQPSCVSHIGNVDLAATMPNGVNAAFTVEAWANCIAGNGLSGGAPVVSQGSLGASSFFLGVDTNSATKHYQFYVRGADGTLYSADDTTIEADDLNWHYLAGVCDEANGSISLYIDGQLAASAHIPANSGIFESHMPVAIGAGIRSGSSDYNVPFTGHIADVAIYGHALSIGQIINHYGTAGGTVPVSFIPPLPPTNVAYQANQTLKIPAAASGSAPLGYYWLNLTAGGVVGSGSVSGAGSLDATLTIPNASAALSGDQLELVVTNATSSTNWVVTLFAPPAPVTLDYSNPILYSNNFNGGAWSITGMPLTAANILVGGTNTTWIDADGTNNPYGLLASGVSVTTNLGDSWLVPFTPHSGYVYTETVSVTFSGNPGSWTGPGFAELTATNVGNGTFNHNVTGYNWPILTESSGGIQYFAGPGTSGGAVTNSTLFTSGPGTHTVQVVLDTTGSEWSYHMMIDGNSSFTYTYNSNPTNINAVGIQQNALGAPNFIKWNSFSLTQEAPGGVPPYLLDPQPPTSIVLTNGTVTIPATAFGSAPFGYYWSNNSTIIASGVTNNMAPLPASLSISSSSLSIGQLDLVVTNAYGTNITLITLAPPINPNPTNIVFSVTAGQMTLSWPEDHTGWTLQAQTNALSNGLGTNWVDVPNSSMTNQVTFPVDMLNESVFYRLILP